MEARVPIMAGNWKMNKTPSEAAGFAQNLAGRLGGIGGVELVVAPPFTALPGVCGVLRQSSIGVAAQNMHWEQSGAFTGEVAPGMLRDLGVQWVILGHSERRQLFGETDEDVARKAKSALEWELTPIICVGETEEEREAGRTEEIVARQVRGALADLDASAAARIVIAYEPVWAIGTGRTATPELAEEACGFVRSLLGDHAGGEAAGIRILYGGSVKPENTADLMKQENIDGGLVGGASLDAGFFAEIVSLTGRAA